MDGHGSNGHLVSNYIKEKIIKNFNDISFYFHKIITKPNASEYPENILECGVAEIQPDGTYLVNTHPGYDEINPESIEGNITQPPAPLFEEPAFKSLNAVVTQEKITINWEIDPTTCPCYEYGIYIYRYSKTEYEFVYNYVTSRPEVTSYSYSEPPFSGNYLITLECKGISNFLYSDSVYKSIKN